MGFLRRRLKSVSYAIQGIGVLMRTQVHARLHLVATLVVIGLGFYFKVSRMEWALLLVAMALVWVAESINTAIEFLVDLVSPGYHHLAAKVKDVAAAAVLLASGFALALGLIVFLNKF